MIKSSKYRNLKTVIDGITFDSKLEAEYYEYLKGFYREINVHVHVPCVINGKKVFRYIADFYIPEIDEYHDVKGATFGAPYQYFKLKCRILKAAHDIDVYVITKKKKLWNKSLAIEEKKK